MPDNKQNQFNWNHAKAFLVTAEKGSLSAAADELGLTQPTLSRHIAALEKSTGVALFEKGPKRTEGQKPLGRVLMSLTRTAFY